MNLLEKNIKEISAVARILWERGWAESGAGNISVDITGFLKLPKSAFRKNRFSYIDPVYPELSSSLFLATGTGARMRDAAERPLETLLLLSIDKQGSGYYRVQDASAKKEILPTSELPVHFALHNLLRQGKSSARALLHAHPTELIALMHAPECSNEGKLNDILYKMYPEASVVNPYGVALIPYNMTGSGDLAAKTLKGFRSNCLFLWEKHGCLAMGEDIQAAFDVVDVMNKSAQLYLLCRSAGYDPSGLSETQITELKKKFSKF